MRVRAFSLTHKLFITMPISTHSVNYYTSRDCKLYSTNFVPWIGGTALTGILGKGGGGEPSLIQTSASESLGEVCYMHTHVHACTHTTMYEHTHTHACTHTNTYLRTRTHAHTHMHIHTSSSPPAYTHAHTRTFIRARTHAHTHTH